METGDGSPDELALAQRGQSRRLVEWMRTRGMGGLDGSPASLGQLDDLLRRLHPDGFPDADVDRLAPLVAAYAGEVLIATVGGAWVLDPDAGAPLVEAPDRFRVCVHARARRLLRDGPASAHGMASLLERTRSLLASRENEAEPAGEDGSGRVVETVVGAGSDGSDAARPGTRGRGDRDSHGRLHSPLGGNRPLGLRRTAFYDEDTTDPEPILDVVPFRPVAQGALGSAAKDTGFGPSLFVWVMILIVIGVVAYAAYLYRNAPP